MADSATLDHLGITAIRTLSMDGVQQANSGHPGTPVALAPVVYTLWQQFLRFDPAEPVWPNRDRFVLSCGHASMLLYSILHLTGVKAVDANYETPGAPSVTLDDIKKFRQLHSKCPGHPEYRWTSGVETTTGPLGQGVATSVGMAIAAKWMAAHFNKPGFELFDYNVYALAGDGCMMEGISTEAASLAGHLKLDNLCWIYDNNKITIEGATSLAFSEDVATKYQGLGWNVTRVGDANDADLLASAIKTFQGTKGKPTLIIVDSHIAWGVPGKEGHHSAHGEPLGDKAIEGAKAVYGCADPKAKFSVPPEVYTHFQAGIGARGKTLSKAWWDLIAKYKAQFPELAKHLEQMQKRELPEGWDSAIKTYPTDAKGMAGRISSGEVLNAIASKVPWLVGGAADLAPSTKTMMTFEGAGHFSAENYGGRNMHYGIREHAMGAILNGMSVSKVRPYGSGFLIFSDYGRNPIRLAAIMEIPVIYIFTHDSIGVGEDGPTHQPIEQLASLRAIPNLLTIRPCDANEVAEAWRYIMPHKKDPVVLILTRQDCPTLDRAKYGSAKGLHMGGYILADAPGGKPDVILIGTGSEVSLAVSAHEALTASGVKSRVVSMPCWELFEKQDAAYRESILPNAVRARVAVEQAGGFGWERYVGLDGELITMKTFGASAPLKELQKEFGFTTEKVVEAAQKSMAKVKK